MRGTIKNRIKESIEKNAPEAKALLTGQMPSFIIKGGRSSSSSDVPVFVFHAVEPERLEHQLLYLRSNGYRTLDADGVEDAVQERTREGEEVGLTFDDATWTFWAYGFPLLKKYNFRAILFAIPGLVPNDSPLYPSIEDVWEGTCSLADLEQRREIQPLCTWRELAIMHQSGLVDIQSHSLTHARVPVSPRVVDFIHPSFDPYFFGNVNVPISPVDNEARPERKLRLGAPVLESAPRLACRLRFRENPELVEAMTRYVQEQGGDRFFECPIWRKKLTGFFKRWAPESLGRLETIEDLDFAVRRELVESKKILEERLYKKVHHFCYPWFAGSEKADRFAAEYGYHTVHCGLETNCEKGKIVGAPIRIRRISEEYLFRLPGKGRSSIVSIWADRIRRFQCRR